ncbi:unnamed protein product [Rhizoctonia solani]|uniref:ER membrane protein complex subunit 6 n=1 Tax=Rhizoctonia solani TaxID=456999 RepID=A0A8H3C4A6_9AGAM|nr:unnamed protein product [Rhizoctonia solani]
MSNPAELRAQRIFPQNAQHNALVLSNIKFVSSCFAGAVAGILGLQNLYGFLLFALSLCATAGVVASVSMKGAPIKRYAAGGWSDLVNPGQENIFSFVLLWTLFYGIVHGMPAIECGIAATAWFKIKERRQLSGCRRRRALASSGESSLLEGTNLGGLCDIDAETSEAAVHVADAALEAAMRIVGTLKQNLQEQRIRASQSNNLTVPVDPQSPAVAQSRPRSPSLMAGFHHVEKTS